MDMPQKFDVVFQRDSYPYDVQIVASGLSSVAEAKKRRQVSGDIVVFSGTKNIVRNKTWFWKWEVENDSYPKRRINSPDLGSVTHYNYKKL